MSSPHPAVAGQWTGLEGSRAAGGTAAGWKRVVEGRVNFSASLIGVFLAEGPLAPAAFGFRGIAAFQAGGRFLEGAEGE